jgi:hypothetical protein
MTVDWWKNLPLVYASPRLMVTRLGLNYQIEVTDKKRLREGKGVLLLTEVEMVELWRLDDKR